MKARKKVLNSVLIANAIERVQLLVYSVSPLHQKFSPDKIVELEKAHSLFERMTFVSYCQHSDFPRTSVVESSQSSNIAKTEFKKSYYGQSAKHTGSTATPRSLCVSVNKFKGEK